MCIFFVVVVEIYAYWMVSLYKYFFIVLLFLVQQQDLVLYQPPLLLLLLLLLFLLSVNMSLSQTCYIQFWLNLVTIISVWTRNCDMSCSGSKVTEGHRGQKVIFTKNAISPVDYTVWSYDSCIFISSIHSTKVFSSNLNLGSFGVTGVKKVIFIKNANLSKLHSMTIQLKNVH